MRGARFDEQAELRSHDIAQRGKGLQRAERHRAKLGRNTFRHQSGGRAKHAAHPEADQKAV